MILVVEALKIVGVCHAVTPFHVLRSEACIVRPVTAIRLFVNAVSAAMSTNLEVRDRFFGSAIRACFDGELRIFAAATVVAQTVD
jgi:hypothetical protein